MKKKWILVLISLFVFGCDASSDNYSKLPKEQQEAVLKIDKQINELQQEMKKYLHSFQKEEVESQSEVFDEWREFSTSVKEASINQEKASKIREKIVELQQEKMKILEIQTPQK